MELDKETIKVLSSDTRVDMMKSLARRRKMPSELSKELGLAGSTVVEHLKKLESAGLVVKRETGRKWIYYELTTKGRNLVKPKFPVEFVVMLSLGVLLVFGGMSGFMPDQQVKAGAEEMLRAPIGSEVVEAANYAPEATFTLVMIAIIIVGIALMIYSLVKLWQRSRLR